MAYEELVVVGFGVALAVLSVSIFWAHVRRINAPNRGDPGGSRVAIHLAAAIAQDEAALRTKTVNRKDYPECSAPKGKVGVPAVGKPGLCTEDVSGRLSGKTRCPSESTGRLQAGSIHAEPPTEQQGAKVPCSTILIPTTAWAEAMIAHARMKRKTFLDMIKVGGKGGKGGKAPGWEYTWMQMTPERRRAVLETVRQELVHAVSAYTGNDEVLFSTICPDVSVGALLEQRGRDTGLKRFILACSQGKFPVPRSRAHAAVLAAVLKVAPTEEDRKGPVSTFLQTFRKLSSYSFCIGVLEAIRRDQEREEGSGGPTLSSVVTALVRTGCSTVLVWAFFHGLKEMSQGTTAGTGEGGFLTLGGRDDGGGAGEGVCEARVAWGMIGGSGGQSAAR